MFAAPEALACTVMGASANDLGSYSAAAVNAAVVPPVTIKGGLSCTPGVLTLFGGNYIKAKFHSDNGLILKRAGGGTIAYTASADPQGNFPFGQDKTIDYAQNNLLNLLGLLGGSSGDMPITLKLPGGVTPPPGTYTDRVTVTWDWSICPLAVAVCLAVPDKGVAVNSVITLTLDVSAKNLVLQTTTQTTWDPVSGTNRPKALPGSKQRWSVDAYNPDLLSAQIAITVPLPTGVLVALDGDGTGSGNVFKLTEGSPASGLSLMYQSPASTTDNVDFSADGGATWTYVPVTGDTVSLARITHLRFRPQGAMAAGSRFSVSVPMVTR